MYQSLYTQRCFLIMIVRLFWKVAMFLFLPTWSIYRVHKYLSSFSEKYYALFTLLYAFFWDVWVGYGLFFVFFGVVLLISYSMRDVVSENNTYYIFTVLWLIMALLKGFSVFYVAAGFLLFIREVYTGEKNKRFVY